MPICSYVVHPVPGRKRHLVETLKSIKGCEVMPANTHELLILVTETSSPREENVLLEKLKHQCDIECMSLAFGEIHASQEVEPKHD